MQHARLRARIFVSLILLTPLGFASKFYSGPGAKWVNDHLGGMLYEMFWIWLVLWLAPKWSVGRIAICVFIVTALLEFLQLWQPPLLQAVRANFIGRTLIGDTFTWHDFPYYGVGCALGWAWGCWQKKRLSKTANAEFQVNK